MISMKKKIFLMVGSTYPFDRLVKQLDLLGKEFEIFAQIGESALKPKNISFKKFLSYEEIQKKVSWANIIVTHAGVGTIIDCLKQKKQIILFPRLKRFGEAIDDHQIEICKVFEIKFGLKWAINEKEIEKLLEKSNNIKTKKEGNLLKEIKKIIDSN